MTKEEVEILQISGYQVAAFSTRCDCVGGGTMILIKEYLEIGNVYAKTDFNIVKCIEYCSIFFKLLISIF